MNAGCSNGRYSKYLIEMHDEYGEIRDMVYGLVQSRELMIVKEIDGTYTLLFRPRCAVILVLSR